MGVDSTIFITDFTILLGNVHLLISETQRFRIQGYETHNYGNFFKYANISKIDKQIFFVEKTFS